MIIRHLVADLGLAALIAVPAVLPAAPTPRSVDSHLAMAKPSANLVVASNDRGWNLKALS
jgi:hypothetical protein